MQFPEKERLEKLFAAYDMADESYKEACRAVAREKFPELSGHLSGDPGYLVVGTIWAPSRG